MRNTIRAFLVFVAAGAVAFGLLYRPAAEIKNRTDNIWLLSLLVAGIALLGAFWAGRRFFNLKGLGPEERLRHNVQRVSSVIIVGFILISLQLFRVSFVIAGDIEKPYQGTNAKGQAVVVQDPRRVDEPLTNQRGRIYDASGKEVAGITVSKDGYVRRTYAANSPITQLLGYYNPLRFGISGLEDTYNDYLSGKNSGNAFLDFQRDLLNQPTVGNDLYLTIDPNLQQVAQNALGQTSGAIVLMDGKSGAVLAMVGYPRYDPSLLVADPTIADPQQQKAYNDQVQQRWEALNKDPNSPLLLRPTQGLYIPGSTFKTVTLAGVLDSGKTTPQATWEDKGFYVVDSHRIDDNNRPNQNTTWTTEQGYMFSLNAVFAQLGLQLGQDGLVNYTQRFGFEKDIPFDLPTSTSQNEVDKNFLAGKVAQAETGFGQGQLLVSPLHWAMLAAAIGRGDGVLPKPYLVQQIKNRDKAVIKETKPEPWLQAIRPETAATVRNIMIASATDGWVGLNGGGLRNSGAVVGGKTGTAELGNNINNAWYIAWASKGDRLFAIAVVADHRPNGEGLRDAMPRANQVLLAALATVK
jgi:peptidoglycan glycosyltransferase